MRSWPNRPNVYEVSDEDKTLIKRALVSYVAAADMPTTPEGFKQYARKIYDVNRMMGEL